MPPSSFFFLWQLPLFSFTTFIHPSIHPYTRHPSIHLATRRHSSLHPAYPLSSSYSVHYIHPSSLILSSPALLYVSHPSASSFTPRANLSSPNSLLAEASALLNYSGSIICFLFFPRLVFTIFHSLPAFFLFISQEHDFLSPFLQSGFGLLPLVQLFLKCLFSSPPPPQFVLNHSPQPYLCPFLDPLFPHCRLDFACYLHPLLLIFFLIFCHPFSSSLCFFWPDFSAIAFTFNICPRLHLPHVRLHHSASSSLSFLCFSQPGRRLFCTLCLLYSGQRMSNLR